MKSCYPVNMQFSYIKGHCSLSPFWSLVWIRIPYTWKLLDENSQQKAGSLKYNCKTRKQILRKAWIMKYSPRTMVKLTGLAHLKVSIWEPDYNWQITLPMYINSLVRLIQCLVLDSTLELWKYHCTVKPWALWSVITLFNTRLKYSNKAFTHSWWTAKISYYVDAATFWQKVDDDAMLKVQSSH